MPALAGVTATPALTATMYYVTLTDDMRIDKRDCQRQSANSAGIGPMLQRQILRR
jgi:hypothetical protein